MIKVLKKAFGILEHVSYKSETPPLLGEIAERLDLNQPTTSRIVKDLTELGYLEQQGPRKGFILGPQAYTLTAGKPYRRDIANIATPLINECAKTVKESVLIAVINKGKRYILCHCNGNPELQVIIDKPYYEDIYTTATGRLLLAYSPEENIKKYIAQNGLPEDKWKNMTTEKALFEALEKIRKEAFIIDNSQQLTILSYPVFQGSAMVAALGVSVPKMNFTEGHKKLVLSEAQKTAKEISFRLA